MTTNEIKRALHAAADADLERMLGGMTRLEILASEITAEYNGEALCKSMLRTYAKLSGPKPRPVTDAEIEAFILELEDDARAEGPLLG